MKTELTEFGNIYGNHRYNHCMESAVLAVLKIIQLN